jgi:hypothetical protein
MPRFSRERNFNSPERRPKQRPGPGGYPPQRFEPRQFRDKPPPRPAKPRRPAGPARIEPRQPTGSKDRRRMLKAAAWRLAKIIHVRPAEVLKALAMQPKLDAAFPNRASDERWGEAARLAVKVWRLQQARTGPPK